MSDRGDDLVHFDPHIVRDPEIRGGEPVFRGTRVTRRTVLASLAAGDTAEAILADFPRLSPPDIQAAIAFRRREEGVFRHADLDPPRI